MKKNKSKKKQKSLNKLYGDFLYNSSSMEYSQDQLMDDANQYLRLAYSHMEDLLAKTYFLVENGEASRAELRKMHQMSEKLSNMIQDFKYSFMR